MQVAVGVLAVLVVVLGVVAARQHSRLVDLRARVALPTTASNDSGEHDAIVIVIRNHAEVAADRNPLARTLSVMSPGLVRGLVHRETVSELRTRLEAEGIDADVRVRRVIPRDRGT